MAAENLTMDYTKYDFKDSTEMYVHLSKKGLSPGYHIGHKPHEGGAAVDAGL